MAGDRGKRKIEAGENAEEEEEVPQLILRRNRPLGLMSPLSDQNPRARTGATAAPIGSSIRAIPISSLPPRASGLTITSGRSAGSASRTLPPEEREWLDPAYNAGIMAYRPYTWWTKNNVVYRFAEQIEICYEIMESDECWCQMPTSTKRIQRAPPCYIGVYTSQL